MSDRRNSASATRAVLLGRLPDGLQLVAMTAVGGLEPRAVRCVVPVQPMKRGV